jgi:hypothetical protein
MRGLFRERLLLTMWADGLRIICMGSCMGFDEIIIIRVLENIG